MSERYTDEEIRKDWLGDPNYPTAGTAEGKLIDELFARSGELAALRASLSSAEQELCTLRKDKARLHAALSLVAACIGDADEIVVEFKAPLTRAIRFAMEAEDDA